MTDAFVPPSASPEPAAGQAQELEVDLAAFLPDGVELGEDTVDDADEATPAADDATPAAADTAIDATPAPEAEPTAEAPEAAAAPAAHTVDLEALSQIERDLDAVDAAIAALDAGTYGTDPATGGPIDDALLAEDPTRLS